VKTLNFEVNNQIITRLDDNILVNKSRHYVKCCFEFKTTDWQGIEKFALFKDSWGNTYRVYLEAGCTCECEIPHDALKGTNFRISLYGGDLITTNELRVLLIPSGYTTRLSNASVEDKDIFIQIFEELQTKIDKVIYEDNCIRCYAGDELLCEVPLIVDEELNSTSINPVQNRVVNAALEGKEDAFDFVERMDITIQNLIGRE